MIELHNCDCLEFMKGMDANSVDAIVTDPPYGLSFMGKKWDYEVPGVAVWAECLRVLKPGGHLLAFAGTRTQHRMCVNIEDAGFEIRDMIAWVYGSGFPKSLDVSKAIDKAAGAEREVVGVAGKSGSVRNSMAGDFAGGEYMATAPATDAARQWQGWGTALKPAMEPITMARKPLIGTVAANVLEHGTGAINVDGCRIATNELTPRNNANTVTLYEKGFEGVAKTIEPSPLGRWPANLIHDGSEEVVALFPEVNAGVAVRSNSGGNTFGGSSPKPAMEDLGYGDKGSAARFFKTCEHDDFPLLLCDAKAIFGAWKTSPANTAESPSHQPSPSADFVRDLVLFAEHCGATLQSRRWTEHFTNATPIELSDLCTLVTMAILFTEARSWRVSQPAKHTLPNSRVSIAETNEQTGITTITIDRSTSDGFAEVATFGIMPLNAVRGEAASASRLVYCAKASKSDRGESNGHPTVKPTELMRYLVRLVTPPGGKVIDPFTGSGSTGKAAILEGFQFIGMEREAEYIPIIKARCAWAVKERAAEQEVARLKATQTNLFAEPKQQPIPLPQQLTIDPAA